MFHHLQHAIIKMGVNADSWVKLFNNLTAIKIRKINRVKKHILVLDLDMWKSLGIFLCLKRLKTDVFELSEES